MQFGTRHLEKPRASPKRQREGKLLLGFTKKLRRVVREERRRTQV